MVKVSGTSFCLFSSTRDRPLTHERFQEERKVQGDRRFSSDNGRQVPSCHQKPLLIKLGDAVVQWMLNVEQEKSMAVLSLWK